MVIFPCQSTLREPKLEILSMPGVAQYGTVPCLDNPVRQGLDSVGCHTVRGFCRVAGAPQVRVGTGSVAAESGGNSFGLAQNGHERPAFRTD